MGEKMGGKMGEKMGEERCEGERETAQVSSSVAVVVDVQWPQMRDAVSPSSRPCLYLAVPARFRFRHVSACSRPGGTADAGSCQVRSCSGEEARVDAAFGARSGPVRRHSGVLRAYYKTPSLLKGSSQRNVVARER